MRIALLLLIVVVTRTNNIYFQSFVQNTGIYLVFLQVATWTESYTGSNWQNAWTVFYWGWWIAWSPFVGMFIARISKGVLFVSLFWEFY
jgi:choline/glycine/proline betaine transport protein